jgi:class 3 adenylate cyclase
MAGAGDATYTVMFTDLVDSTAQRARLGDNLADELHLRHQAILSDIVVQHHGVVVNTTGDGIMAAFHGAADGIACAVASQQAIHALNLGAWNQGAPEPLSMRIGLSLGDARMEDDDLHGTPVVEAARLCAAAQGGEILCADLVRIVAGSRADQKYTPVGELELKGLPEPVVTVRVEWEPRAGITPGGAPFPAALDPGARLPFIGREAELDRLLTAWRKAVDGEAGLVLLGGEPGIGKTRLAAELARRVHAQGMTVLFGHCDDELGVPYQPFVEALAFVVDHFDERALDALERPASELVRLVPRLADRLPGLAPPISTDPETSQYRLFEAVAAALVTGSEIQPILFVIDDLHWAAKPTLLMLRHVVATAARARVLIVGTYRDTDLQRGNPLGEMLADFRRVDRVQRIPLSGLAEPEVVELLTRIAQHELDDAGVELARMIHEETEGNPLFTGEVLRHLRDTGAIYEQDGRWVTRGDVAEIGIPDGVRDVIGRRLDRLSPVANDVLQTAAVIGRDFDLAVVERLVDHDRDAIVEALDDAVDARLVYEAGIARYTFAHALVRSALYDELRPTRRAHMHERVADAISALFATDLDAHLGELAYHYAQSVGAGDANRAIEFSCRAGEHALEQFAPEEAITWFQQARDLVEVGGGDAAPLGRVLLGLGTAEKFAGQPTFRETLLLAARTAQERRDDPLLIAAALANNRGFWSSYGAVDHERVAVLRTAIARSAACPATHRARLLANLATEVVFEDDLATRRALDDEALALARTTDDPATLAHVLISRCVSLWHPSSLDDRLRHGEELAGLVEELGDPHLAFFAHWYRYAALIEAGRIAEADRALAVGASLAGQLGPAMPVWVSTFTRSARALFAGDTETAEALATEQLELGERAGQPDAALYYGVIVFTIRMEQGRLAEIADFIEAAGSGPDALVGLDALWGLTACTLGRDDDARQVLDKLAVDGFARVPEHQTWSSVHWAAARIATHLGDRERAELLYARLLPYAHHLVFPGLVVFDSVAATLGELAGILDLPDDAARHFDRGLKIAEASKAPLLAARTRARRDALLG